jgi:hypothetical protein
MSESSGAVGYTVTTSLLGAGTVYLAFVSVWHPRDVQAGFEFFYEAPIDGFLTCTQLPLVALSMNFPPIGELTASSVVKDMFLAADPSGHPKDVHPSLSVPFSARAWWASAFFLW